MAKITMKALLESGVHFGHRTHRWNPNMAQYIFTERNGIHILDLQQTVKAIAVSYKVISKLVADGGTILFVGTKRQATETIVEEATRCGMPYVTVRWLGGMLTNWKTMRERINELERLERMRERGDFERLTKKEGLMLTRKIEKLEARFGGIRKMHGLPDMLFVVDVKREDTTIKEANTLKIPIVALVDTNANPNLIEHVIPSNDDAIRAIKLLVGHMADAVMEGRAAREDDDDFEQPKMAEDEITTIDEMSDQELLGEATLKKMAVAEAEHAANAAAEAAELEKKAAAKEEAEAATDETAESDQEADAKEEAEAATDETAESDPEADAKEEAEAATDEAAESDQEADAKEEAEAATDETAESDQEADASDKAEKADDEKSDASDEENKEEKGEQ